MISLRWEELYLPQFIYVSTLNEFAMELDVLLFDFTWTRYGCESHGLSISDDATDTSDWFCGKRLPWTIIRFKSRAYIKIVISSRQYFKVRLFYSSQHLTWLTHLFLHSYIHLAHVPVATIAITVEDIENYHYYVITNPFKILVFTDIKMTSIDGKVTFYDGPGLLSQQIITLKMFKKLNYTKITTTSFAACVLLQKLRSKNATVHLTVQSIGNRITPKGCIRNVAYFRILFFESTIVRTTFCYVGMTLENPPDIRDMSINFAGPSMSTAGSLFNCQYGGIFLRWKSFGNIVSICDNRSSYRIRSPGKSVQIFIVSYKGYTSFNITAFVRSYENCKTHYLDFGAINTNSLEMTLDPEFDCVISVCSSEYVDGGAPCQINVTSEDGEIGSTHIKSYYAPALYLCTDDGYTDSIKYDITILSSENWPVKPSRYTTYTGTAGTNEGLHMTIPYLREFYISLLYSCPEKYTFHQLAVEIWSFKCTEEDMFPRLYINVTELKEACFNKLMPLRNIDRDYYIERPLPQTAFIFTETCETGRGHMVDFTYIDGCADSCRRFMYILQVWRKGQPVYEYRSPVGQGIFTGCCHQGFRVTLVPPSPETLLNCKCGINFIGTKLHIQENNVWEHGEQIYHLHEARYAIFFNKYTLTLT